MRPRSIGCAVQRRGPRSGVLAAEVGDPNQHVAFRVSHCRRCVREPTRCRCWLRAGGPSRAPGRLRSGRRHAAERSSRCTTAGSRRAATDGRSLAPHSEQSSEGSSGTPPAAPPARFTSTARSQRSRCLTHRAADTSYSPTAGCSRSLAVFRLAASTALKASVRCSFSSVALRLVLPREPSGRDRAAVRLLPVVHLATVRAGRRAPAPAAPMSRD